MTVVSSKEFATKSAKYYNLAKNEQVVIQNGRNRYRLTFEPKYPEQPILEPDDNFRRAISAEEFRERLIVVLDRVDKKYANKCE